MQLDEIFKNIDIRLINLFRKIKLQFHTVKIFLYIYIISKQKSYTKGCLGFITVFLSGKVIILTGG